MQLHGVFRQIYDFEKNPTNYRQYIRNRYKETVLKVNAINLNIRILLLYFFKTIQTHLSIS